MNNEKWNGQRTEPYAPLKQLGIVAAVIAGILVIASLGTPPARADDPLLPPTNPPPNTNHPGTNTNYVLLQPSWTNQAPRTNQPDILGYFMTNMSGSNMMVTTLTNTKPNHRYELEGVSDLTVAFSPTNLLGPPVVNTNANSSSLLTNAFSSTNMDEFVAGVVDTTFQILSDYATYTNSPGGSGSGCPGPYVHYLNFEGAGVGTNWGWHPDSNNFTSFVVMDGTGNTNTRIQYVGRRGDSGCGAGSVTNSLFYSSEYRFTVYFLDTNSFLSNGQKYPLLIRGIDESFSPPRP